MPKQFEGKTKRRFDTTSANLDEGGSSVPNVVNGRELRIRGQKRQIANDIEEESVGGSSDSSDDEVEDETYRVKPRHGKGPTKQNSDSDEDDFWRC